MFVFVCAGCGAELTTSLSQVVLPVHEPHLPAPASGVMPDGVLRDDPPAPHPRSLFRPDPGVFHHTPVRLPAVRSPWLREILRTSRGTRAHLF